MDVGDVHVSAARLSEIVHSPRPWTRVVAYAVCKIKSDHELAAGTWFAGLWPSSYFVDNTAEMRRLVCVAQTLDDLDALYLDMTDGLLFSVELAADPGAERERILTMTVVGEIVTLTCTIDFSQLESITAIKIERLQRLVNAEQIRRRKQTVGGVPTVDSTKLDLIEPATLPLLSPLPSSSEPSIGEEEESLPVQQQQDEPGTCTIS